MSVEQKPYLSQGVSVYHAAILRYIWMLNETSMIEGFIFVKLSESVYCLWAYRFEEKNVEVSTFYWNLLYGNRNFKSFVENV
jgi:hypothetical protein